MPHAVLVTLARVLVCTDSRFYDFVPVGNHGNQGNAIMGNFGKASSSFTLFLVVISV